MNVTGISAPTAPPVAPAITRVQAGDTTAAHPQHHPTESHSGQTGQQTGGTHAPRVPEPPPMKPLSTTEVQVMLGMAPPEVLLERSRTATRKNAFDAYA